MMPNTNYDTRPVAPPFFGSEHTEKPTHVRTLSAVAAWLSGAAGGAVTVWWAWLVADRWANGVTPSSATGTTIAWLGVLALALWVTTVFLVRSWRRS
jgi:hypothetical protein